jgi:hypothetical protein
MVHKLDNKATIPSSCWLSSFQCISSHLQPDQASFGTQALLGPSRIDNKCFGIQMARGQPQGELHLDSACSSHDDFAWEQQELAQDKSMEYSAHVQVWG